MTNNQLCSCCGQPRPYPTEPGEWEYCNWITGNSPVWIRVSVKLAEKDDAERYGDGLRLWESGKMIWWPNNCAWRKNLTN